jgi:hypothetical protein
VKIYIDRDTSSEYFATDLYENYADYTRFGIIEAEMSDEDWLAFNKAVRTYWDWQDKLCDLYEKGKE